MHRSADRRAPRPILRSLVADLPVDLPADLAAVLARVFDVEGKLARAIEELGPVAGRDVVLFDAVPAGLAAQLDRLAAGVTIRAPGRRPADGSADVVIGCWSAFRGAEVADVAAAERILRPGGRLLAVHDYGRDDVSRLLGEDRPEVTSWSRRDGPFLRAGFRIRVIHCFWTFESLDEARAFLEAAFGERGATIGAALHRPRLSHKVAVYQRAGGKPDD